MAAPQDRLDSGSDAIVLRPFVPDDLPALQGIRKAAFAPVFRSFRALVGARIAAVAFVRADEEQAELLASICAPDSGHQVRTLIAGGETVGFVSFRADAASGIGEIGLNAVHPDHAGRGLGTRMFNQVLAEMKAMGMTLASVSTGGDPSHAAARRAYAKVGFTAAIPSVHLYRIL